MRSPLDPLYRFCGALAAVCLALVGVLIAAGIAARLLGINASGLNAYAGYSMAASSFLALAYTFVHGGHIRVALLLDRLQGRARRRAELWCLAVGTALAAYFAVYSARMVWISWRIGDVSQAPDATPLWIPQTAMAVGTAVLAIALLDRLIRVWRGAPVEPTASDDAARTE